MKWTSYLAVTGIAAALAVAPVAAAHAQDRDHAPHREHADSGHRSHGPARMRMGAAERLLSQRTELSLTDDQVRRLEAIRDSFAVKEKPYVDQLQRNWGEHRDSMQAKPRAERGERRERREASPEVRAAMKALRESREASRDEAFSVLTDAQKQQVREQMHERRGERRMRQPRDSAGTRGA